MKALLLLGVLAGFAALNLVLNYVVPVGFKLLLVPAFALVMIIVIARALRRQR